MTLAEAKKKWCPFARVREDVSSNQQLAGTLTWGGQTANVNFPNQAAPVGFVAVNRSYEQGHYACKCLADGCMAWRSVLSDPNLGYCGLAGFKND